MFGMARRREGDMEYAAIGSRRGSHPGCNEHPPPARGTVGGRRANGGHSSVTDALPSPSKRDREWAEGGGVVGASTCGGSACGAGRKASFLSEDVIRALAHGTVNGILLPPVAVSFAAIIFRDPAFAPYLPKLVKLVMFSASVHMACFGSLSTLKFAVGSVQDAGLIFLSAIATSVVVFAQEEGLDDRAMLSSACFVLCTCTGLLGLALVLLGRLRMASIVQYLPMPVIGGYLAYIGFFCGQAGLAFASGLEIEGILEMRKLANRESLTLIAPALAGGVLMYLCLRRFPSPLTLPLLMAGFVGTFFAVLGITRTSLEEARILGWFSAESPVLPLLEAWDYFDLQKMHWMALVRVMPNLLAMTVVVAFSSCLDVAAIEMELGMPLDFDAELQTVGWSNVVSGLSGGFTGSYIFSQTIFNLRAGVDTRVAGATTFALMFAAVASPVSVISYLPKAFFGSLLVLISADLMVEWLWEARHRMMLAEYIVCLCSFGIMQAWGVEKGMFAGLVLAALSFTITYAQAPTVLTARAKGSTVMRTYEERVILQAHRQEMVVLELQGYIFFGSAVKILSEVKDRIVWGTDDPLEKNNADADDSGSNLDEYRSDRLESNEDDNHQDELVANRHDRRLSTHSGRLQLEPTPMLQTLQPRGPPPQALPISFGPARGSSKGRNPAQAIPPALPAAGSSCSSLLPCPTTPNYRDLASVGDISSPVFSRSGRPSSNTSSSALSRGSTSVPNSFGRVTSASWARAAAVSDSAAEDALVVHASYPHAGAGKPRTAAAAPAPGSVSEGIRRSWSHTGGKSDGTANGVDRAWLMSSWKMPRSDRSVGYGSLEEGSLVRGGNGQRGNNCASLAGGESLTSQDAWSVAKGGGSARTGEGAAQAYMSLWANAGTCHAQGSRRTSARGSGGSCGEESDGLGGVRVSRMMSSSQLAPPEQRTRHVILDFSRVVGIDATAARSCFLMLRRLLQTSGADVVFAGVRSNIVELLSAHGVINDEDPVFESLDTALEYSEEMLLKERRRDIRLQEEQALDRRSLSSTAGNPSPSPSDHAGTPALHAAEYGSDAVESSKISPLAPPSPCSNASPNQEEGKGAGGEERTLHQPSSDAAEARVFLGETEGYYARAGKLRMRASTNIQIVREAGECRGVEGDVGSLQSILEDYLEVDRFKAPEDVRRTLSEANRFFKEERVSAGTVLIEDGAASEKLYFIGSGSAELQVQGEHGIRRRLLKVCAGGAFGELGFYLLTPQPLRAVAREDCHLHTLDRMGMAKMQRENPELCVLVQKALMKSICLAASFSIESAHLGGVDDRQILPRLSM